MLPQVIEGFILSSPLLALPHLPKLVTNKDKIVVVVEPHLPKLVTNTDKANEDKIVVVVTLPYLLVVVVITLPHLPKLVTNIDKANKDKIILVVVLIM